MKKINEIESLQNAANAIGLTVIEITVFQDKRKTNKLYFLQRGSNTYSPLLKYSELNHFILGWIECVKVINNHKTN